MAAGKPKKRQKAGKRKSEKAEAILIMVLVLCTFVNAVPFCSFAEEEDEEIPPVFHKDDGNEEVRIIIGKTPDVTIGKTDSITFSVKNTSETDWVETEVWIAQESEFKDYYDEIDDADGETIKTMNPIYPFEITDDLNKHHSIGPVKAGGKKTVTLRGTIKRNLKEGYYPVKVNIARRAKGEDALSSEYEKTVIIWAEVKESTGTSSSDETGTEPVAFALGENQSTPTGVYKQVLDFNVNLRNTGYKMAYDVRMEMELSEDITKFPFEINDGNYDRWLDNVNADQTVEVFYSMAVREDVKSGYYPIKFKIRYREEEDGNLPPPSKKYSMYGSWVRMKRTNCRPMPEKMRERRPESLWTALRRSLPESWRDRSLP